MNDPQIHRESSDTFGRNISADLELLRRISERAEADHSERILTVTIGCAAIFSLIVVGVCIVRAFL